MAFTPPLGTGSLARSSEHGISFGGYACLVCTRAWRDGAPGGSGQRRAERVAACGVAQGGRAGGCVRPLGYTIVPEAHTTLSACVELHRGQGFVRIPLERGLPGPEKRKRGGVSSGSKADRLRGG